MIEKFGLFLFELKICNCFNNVLKITKLIMHKLIRYKREFLTRCSIGLSIKAIVS